MIGLASSKQIEILYDQMLAAFGDTQEVEMDSFFWHPISLVQNLLSQPTILEYDVGVLIASLNLWLSADQVARHFGCTPKHIEQADPSTSLRSVVVSVDDDPTDIVRASRSKNIEFKSSYGYKVVSVMTSRYLNLSNFFVITLTLIDDD